MRRIERRLLRALLGLYPRPFRSRYGDELLESLERDRARERFTGPVGSLAFWAVTLADVARTAYDERKASRPRRHPPREDARHGVHAMNAFLHDLKQAVRVLLGDPSFTLVATVTLALAIGVNTSVFSIVNAVLFKPLPVASPESLVHVYSSVPDGFMSHTPMAPPDFFDLRDESESLRDLSAYAFTGFVLEASGDGEMIMGEVASGSYFGLLGLAPSAGRLFTPADDRRGSASAVAVLSHATWSKRFGRDPTILGSEVRLNGHPVTVVGVGPEGFHGLTRGFSAELWVPLELSRRLNARPPGDKAGPASPGEPSDHESERVHRLDDRRGRWLWVVGRRGEGVTVDETSAELSVIAARLAEAHPETNEDRALLAVPHDRVRILPGVDMALYAASGVVMAVVGLVLLIASSNLANMLLSRAVTRRKEIATRLSLGASRLQLMRQLLTESLLLAFTGGAAGLVIARVATEMFDLMQPRLPVPIPVALDVTLDVRVTTFALLASTLTAVLFGLLPAYQATRTDLAATLQEAGRTGSTSRGGQRLRGALVVSQVALSLLLLVCSGLSLRSMMNAQHIEPGFEPEGVVVAQLSPHLQGYSREGTTRLYQRVVEELHAIPEVRRATVASHLPLTFDIRIQPSAPEGDPRPLDEWDDVDASIVGPGYFEALEIPTLRGRVFDARDTESSPQVVVVNRKLADEFWPGDDALGQRLSIADGGERSDWEVIGVVSNGKYRSLGEPTRPYLYRTYAQRYEAARSIVADFEPASAASPSLVRDAIHRVDSRLAITGLDPMDKAMGPIWILPRVVAAMFGLFGVLGLSLAALGLYGVIAYSVSRRTQEFGIRMAFGADRSAVVRLVVRDGLRLALMGVALGLVAAAASTRILAAALYGISATDLATFVAVTAVLVVVSVVASYLPARRAAGLDPLRALHHD